jgi:hypothetical protein
LDRALPNKQGCDGIHRNGWIAREGNCPMHNWEVRAMSSPRRVAHKVGEGMLLLELASRGKRG